MLAGHGWPLNVPSLGTAVTDKQTLAPSEFRNEIF